MDPFENFITLIGDFLTKKLNFSGFWLDKVQDHFHYRTFTGTVRPDKAINSPFGDMNIHIVYNDISFVGLSQPYGFHDIIHFVFLLYSSHYTKQTSLFSA